MILSKSQVTRQHVRVMAPERVESKTSLILISCLDLYICSGSNCEYNIFPTKRQCKLSISYLLETNFIEHDAYCDCEVYL